MRPTLAKISANLDTIVAAVTRLEARGEAPAIRVQYSIAEFAAICGRTVAALRHRKTWKRYGGIKRGRNVVLPESARLALSQGDRPA